MKDIGMTRIKSASDPNLLPIDIDSAAAMIAKTQKDTGEIPWYKDFKTDPWDHVEAAMGLCIGGYHREALKAFGWLAQTQLKEGCWYAAYKNGAPENTARDTNMSAYIAVGLLHYYLTTGDISLLKNMWGTVQAAIEFVIRMQATEGEIYWAISPEGQIDTMALLAGSSSICMSLRCALVIANQLGYHLPAWKTALKKLETAVATRPYLFNMTKSRYAMDWYYPVLCGIFTASAAQRRIDQYWKKFVINGQGVRCVSDRPWVTVAETSELSLALSAMGNFELAKIVFSWICDKTYEDGSYWCGFTFPDMVIWPEDKTTWTNAVVLMAADALYNLTPAGQLFNHRFWKTIDL
jgi:hypothetical protein